METILSVLGFTTTEGIIWNAIGYIGMVLIIIAVVSQKFRNIFFFFGPLVLLFYAFIYLQNYILASLQFIITVSGLLNLTQVKKFTPILIFGLAICSCLILFWKGQIAGLLQWVSIFGLLGIALGLTQLPHKKAFVIMAIGGALIVIYAFVLQIWVFFVLNIVFFVSNLFESLKKSKSG